MPALINFKICDNSHDCSGLDVCPVGVFEWDEEKKTLVVRNERCINCGQCKNCCPVGAILYAKDEEDYEKLKEEIENDPRKSSDLFVERYGASPIASYEQVDEDTFVTRILQSVKIGVLEVYDTESIQCLLKSIPVSELFAGRDVKYRKMKIDSQFKKKYGVKILPALLFFKDGRLLGKIEGYYEENQKGELLKKIEEILD